MYTAHVCISVLRLLAAPEPTLKHNASQMQLLFVFKVSLRVQIPIYFLNVLFMFCVFSLLHFVIHRKSNDRLGSLLDLKQLNTVYLLLLPVVFYQFPREEPSRCCSPAP